MNKFKKLVAVLVSVVMACVFATGVFATDYVENLSAARAEVNGFLTQCRCPRYGRCCEWSERGSAACSCVTILPPCTAL